jgi:RNA polymerase sigma factor (sigma-70 family)
MANAESGMVTRFLRDLCETQGHAEAPDSVLLERFALRHEESAFAVLLQRHGPMVLSVARRVLNSPQDVEDVFQATFLLLARKAASLRKPGSVGSWLHGAAHRLALKAREQEWRRQAHERRAAQMRDLASRASAWHEVQSALDAALEKLPQRYRTPLVLCYLEGRSHAEVARQLGCPLATVRTRIQRGRERLRNDLARRGFALSTAGVASLLLASTAGAAAPASLASATCKAALACATGRAAAGLSSAAVSGLIYTELRTMFLTRVKTTAVILLAVSLLVAGAAGLGRALVSAHRPPGAAAGSLRRATAPPSSAGEARAKPASDDRTVRTLRGHVLGPDGKPVATAKVYLVARSGGNKAVVNGAVQRDGSFSLTFDTEKLPGLLEVDEPWRDAVLIAVADGLGPAWIRVRDLAVSPWNARLATDLPIEGTLRDLEGKPAAGIEVSIGSIRDWPHPADLAQYLRELPTGRARYVRMNYWWGAIPGRDSSVKTDDRGRFRFTGLGRDRLVSLRVGGPGIAWTTLTVLVRPGKPLAGKEHPGRDAPRFVVHPATFDFPLPPGRTITGVVKDDATGTPLPGMTVRVGFGAPEVLTDKGGRFEIPGVPKNEKLDLVVTPGPANAGGHLGTSVDLGAGNPGLGTVRAEVRVRKGVRIRARVVEKGSGRDTEADVRYLVLYPNKNVPSGFHHYFARLHRQPDGTYIGAALPGPGAIVVRRSPKRYLPAAASQRTFFKLDTMPDAVVARGFDHDGALWVLRSRGATPEPLPIRQFQAVKFLDPDKDAALIEVKLELDPGESRVLAFTDPDGRPLVGVQLKEATHERWSDPHAAAKFAVAGIGSGVKRLLTLRHEERKLAAVIMVTSATPRQATVVLKPWCTLTGRLLDGKGSLANRVLYGLPEYVVTDKEGRFRIERLPPEHAYRIRFGRDEITEGTFPRAVTVKPGETLDLGDVVVKRRGE